MPIRASSTLAHLLRDRYGVKKGDRVAIAMRNFPEWVVAFWGITTLGAVVVPLNAWWSAEELQYGLEDSGSRVVFADEERAVRLSNVMLRLDLDACIVARARNRLPDGCVAFEELLGSIADYRKLPHDAPPSVELEPEDDATLFYTSGTTGRPKGALGTHRNICINLVSLGFGGARALLRQGQPLPTPDPNAPQRASLLSVPFFHVTGCHSTLLPASRAGSKLVLMYRWDAGEALKLIERERINGIGGVPTMMWQLIQHPDFRSTDLSSVESIGYGGAAAAPELVERLKAEFPQIAGPGQGYGMTETSSIVTSNGGIDYINKPQQLRAGGADLRHPRGRRSRPRRAAWSGRRVVGERSEHHQGISEPTRKRPPNRSPTDTCTPVIWSPSMKTGSSRSSIARRTC